jgi:hypothetical protein
MMQAGMRQQTKTQPGIMQVGMMQASMSQPGIRQPEIMQPGGLQAGMMSEVDMEQSEREDGAAATVTAKALLAGEVSGKVPRLHGTVEKRGSGRGLLGPVRWKSKLLVVCAEVGCVYFVSDEISDKNRAARLMPLGDDGTKIELRADRSGGGVGLFRALGAAGSAQRRQVGGRQVGAGAGAAGDRQGKPGR